LSSLSSLPSLPSLPFISPPGVCTLKTIGKICFRATSAGQYFPIKRIASKHTSGNDACTGNNDVNVIGGVCVGGTHSRCKCGYYGAKCEAGCPNSCSSVGTCASFNTCACNANRVGNDCSQADCPKDQNGYYCSQRGKCSSSAVCTCNDGWQGAACDDEILNLKEGTAGGLGDGGKARGINGMKLDFGGRGGWRMPPIWIIIVVVVVLVLCCCCAVGACVFCYKKQKCCCKKKTPVGNKVTQDTPVGPGGGEQEMVQFTNPNIPQAQMQAVVATPVEATVAI
jgi:hypothetical protein